VSRPLERFAFEAFRVERAGDGIKVVSAGRTIIAATAWHEAREAARVTWGPGYELVRAPLIVDPPRCGWCRSPDHVTLDCADRRRRAA
jgi:hypothetical protein